MINYAGHESQLFGVEEHRLVGGKGDGLRLFEVNNGRGVMFTISADRAGDISRLYYKGNNLGFFAPCGYVSPNYYDKEGLGFLKSFTAGFFTTCGFAAVGSPCNDNGEELGLHGTIGNTPAENVGHWVAADGIHVKLEVRDAYLFGNKYLLTREYIVPTDRDEIILRDTVKNIGDTEVPYMVLYHINIGYPLLSEKSVVTINNKGVVARSANAEAGINDALKMEVPQAGYEEQCFFYDMPKGEASVYNPDINVGLSINYDTKELPRFTEWKMMGKGQYALGLEPGNCTPEGRDVLRKRGELVFLAPGEEKTQTITFKLSSK
ncbi:MAG: aldose 1-epimerase family protein [Oscillospiraceae bacterium]|nr:aldose 1-epimerase family protein [Oscillospiraceae bacterium]